MRLEEHPIIWVPKVYGVELADVISERRTKHLSTARKRLALELSKIGLSYREIGKLLRRSKRDIYYLIHTYRQDTNKI